MFFDSCLSVYTHVDRTLVQEQSQHVAKRVVYPTEIHRSRPPKTLRHDADKEANTNAAGRCGWGESGMKSTHVLRNWKGHTVDTAPHARGPASIASSPAAQHAHKDRRKKNSKCFNVSVHIWSHADRKAMELIMWRTTQGKEISRGTLFESLDLVQFTGFSWLTVHVGWFSHMAWSVILCALHWFLDLIQVACKEAIGQMGEIAESHNLRLPPYKEFKETRTGSVKVQRSQRYYNIRRMVFCLNIWSVFFCVFSSLWQ